MTTIYQLENPVSFTGKWFLLSILICSFIVSSAFSSPKDTVRIRGIISQNTTWDASHAYVLSHNLLITNDAELTIDAGVTVLIDRNASLVIEGGLKVNGEANKLVKISSRTNNNDGIGIVIRGVSNKSILIKYTELSNLILPLELEIGWLRTKVDILDNIFSGVTTGESVFSMQRSKEDYNQALHSEVNIRRNVFINNWGSIDLNEYDDKIVALTFNNNTVCNNMLYKQDELLNSNAIVYGYYDGQPGGKLADISGNSIFHNFQVDAAADTIMRESNLGIEGEGQAFGIPDNFFLRSSKESASERMMHFFQNSDLPLLVPDPLAIEPKAENHGMIWKVIIENKELNDYGNLPYLRVGPTQFEVYFNRSVQSIGNKQIQFIVIDSITHLARAIDLKMKNAKWSNSNKTLRFVADMPADKNKSFGYLVLFNFKDSEGFATPEFTIGHRFAYTGHNAWRDEYNRINFFPFRNRFYDMGNRAVAPEIGEIKVATPSVPRLEE